MEGKDEKLLKFDMEEYEMTFFGFTINDFNRENFKFFQNQVHQSIDHVNKIFMNNISNDSESASRKITELTSIIEKKILDSCRPKLEKIVNDEMTSGLFIPDQVIFPEDRAQTKELSNEEIIDLKKECDELFTKTQQNSRFLTELKKELSAYDIGQHLETEDELFGQAENFLNNFTFDKDSLSSDVLLENLFSDI